LAHAAAAAHAAASAATAAAASLEDFRIACALREQRASVAVLLCGTSGTGKSTLAALLAARLGISTVVSTDSIRHMLRRWVGGGAPGRSAVCVRSALCMVVLAVDSVLTPRPKTWIGAVLYPGLRALFPPLCLYRGLFNPPFFPPLAVPAASAARKITRCCGHPPTRQAPT
jgi:hypothetical protein